MRRSWLDDTDGGWIAHRLTLLLSPAWQARPKPLAGILERLEIEHMRHRGLENGNLIVSFDQFVAYGVSRKIIRAAELCGQSLGLIEVRQAEELAGGVRAPNRYRLTYVPEKGKRAPTDEWQDITTERTEVVVAAFQNIASQKRGPSSPRVTHAVPHGELTSTATSSPFAQTPVTQGERSLISTPLPSSVQVGGAARHQERRSKPPAARTKPSLPLIAPYRMGEAPPEGYAPLGPTVNRMPAGERGPVQISETLAGILKKASN